MRTASPETPSSPHKHQHHRGCWLGNGGIRYCTGAAADGLAEIGTPRVVTLLCIAERLAPQDIVGRVYDAVVVKITRQGRDGESDLRPSEAAGLEFERVESAR